MFHLAGKKCPKIPAITDPGIRILPGSVTGGLSMIGMVSGILIVVLALEGRLLPLLDCGITSAVLFYACALAKFFNELK